MSGSKNPSDGAEIEDAMDPTGAHRRRVRMNLALESVALQDAVGVELLPKWLLMQPLPDDDDEQDPVQLCVSVPAPLDGMTWSGAGETGRMMEVVAQFLANIDTPMDERELLSRIGPHIEPESLGSFIDVRMDGLDVGWVMQGPMALARALVAAADAPLLETVIRWAAEFGVHDCVQLKRSVAGEIKASEYVVSLPGVDIDEKLAVAKQLFDRLDIDWFHDKISLALLEAEPEEVGLVVALTDEGCSRLGLVIEDPVLPLTLLLCDAAGGVPPDKLATFEGIVGTEPAWLVCSRRASGVDVELTFLMDTSG